jgi:hypothetical protein
LENPEFLAAVGDRILFGLIMSLRHDCQEKFGYLLIFQKKLIENVPQNGSARLEFCVALMKPALDKKELRERIKPEVFGEAIMMHG